MLDTVIGLLADLGLYWIAAGPNCPKCGGEGIRPKKRPDGTKFWHCKECCNEWVSSGLEVLRGNDTESGGKLG